MARRSPWVIYFFLLLLVFVGLGCVSSQIRKSIKDLNSPDANIRAKAQDVLIKIGKPAIPALLAFEVKSLPSSLGGRMALQTVEKMENRAVQPLVSILTNEEVDIWLRINAARVLGNIGEKRASPYLISVLSNEQDARLLGVVAFVLAQLRAPEAVEALIKLIEHEDWCVRMAVLESLRLIGEPSIKALTRDLNNENWKFRRRALEALGYIGNKETISNIENLLNDPNEEVRKKAKEALKEIKKNEN